MRLDSLPAPPGLPQPRNIPRLDTHNKYWLDNRCRSPAQIIPLPEGRSRPKFQEYLKNSQNPTKDAVGVFFYTPLDPPPLSPFPPQSARPPFPLVPTYSRSKTVSTRTRG